MHTIDEIIIQWFNSDFGTNFSGGIFGNILLVIFSLLLAALFTGFIGIEREVHGHSAGLRTHLLVAIGSALIMVISIGAGTIVKSGISVRGLTTATTLWISMAIGLACGSGNFVIAGIATIVAVVALISMRRVERAAARKHPVLIVVFPSDRPIIKDLLLTAERYGITFSEESSELLIYQEKSAVRLMMRLSANTPASISAFVEEARVKLQPLEIKFQTEN